MTDQTGVADLLGFSRESRTNDLHPGGFCLILFDHVSAQVNLEGGDEAVRFETVRQRYKAAISSGLCPLMATCEAHRRAMARPGARPRRRRQPATLPPARPKNVPVVAETEDSFERRFRD